MPALGCTRASVASEISALLSGSQRGVLSRTDAHAQHVELLANAPLHVLQRLQQTVETESTEHRTFVVAEHKNQRLPREIIAQPDGFIFLVLKFQIQRKLLIELLLENNF